MKFVRYIKDIDFIPNPMLLLLLILLFTWIPQISMANTTGLPLIDFKQDGVDSVEGLGEVNAIAISPDGKHLYATSSADHAVAIFSRDSAGSLTFQEAITNSDIGNNGLAGANGVVVSPDGKHVYVASAIDNAVTVFTRNLTTGNLTLVEIQQDGVNGGDGLAGAMAIAISSDNKRVYVVGRQDNAVSVFARDVNTGILTFIVMQQDGINNVGELAGATDVAVSKDNIFIYVTSNTDNAITVFTRNPQKGEIAFEAAYKNGAPSVGDKTITGLNGAYGIAMSPDNNHIYVTSSLDNAVVVFLRNTSTGELIYLETYKDGENGIDGLSDARDIAISPDGKRVYVAGISDHAIAVFNRDATAGGLQFLQAVKNNTNDINTLNAPIAVISSPDSNFIYTAAIFSNAVSAFATVSTDLAVTMTGEDIVAVNGQITYSITVTNHGPDSATGVILTDTLPPEVTFFAVEPSQGTCTSKSATVECALATLEKDQTATVTVQVTTPATVTTGSLINQATVTSDQADSNTANNSAVQNTQLKESVPTADLQVNITTDKETVSKSSLLTYTVTVSNQSLPDQAPTLATNVILTNTLPTGVTYQSSDSGVNCTLTNNNILTCPLGNLNVGDSIAVPIQVTTPNTKDIIITLTASAKSEEFDPTPAIDTQENAIGELEVDLAIVDVFANPTTNILNLGEDITYAVLVKNNSNNNTTATGVTLTTTLPPQMAYIAKEENCAYSFPTITCQLSDIKPQFVEPVNLTLRAVQPGAGLSTIFTVDGDGIDPVEANNLKVAKLDKTIGVAADLVVTMDNGGQAVLIGEKITYTVTVANNGPNETAATLNADLTGNNVLVGAITGDNCSSGAHFTCALETMPAGQMKTVSVEATPTTLGTVVLTIDVIGEGLDPTLPNTATLETAVSNKKANLTAALDTDLILAFVGRPLTYTATITNSGPSQATGVVLKQELDPSVTFGAAKTSQGLECTEVNNLVTCPLGPLNYQANDNTATVEITVIPREMGNIRSTVTVSSEMSDPNLADNIVSREREVNQLVADMSLTINAIPNPVVVENLLTYTLTIQNNGPYSATNIQLLNQLPENVLFKGASVLQQPNQPETGDICGNINQAGEVICTIVAIPKNGQKIVTLDVQPLLANQLTLTANVTADEFDSDQTNNSGTIETQVNHPATLFFGGMQTEGFKGVQGLQGVIALALSPDEGQHVYAASFTNNALVVFTRNPTNGQLEFIQTVIDGTNNVDGLAGASDVSLSPDGAFVYATGFSDNAVVVFNRNALNGTLSFVEIIQDGINEVDGLAGALGIVATATHVYVTGATDDAIAIFRRQAETGKLTFQKAIRFEEPAQTLDGVSALAMSPDGLHLLATSTNSNRLSVFQQDTANNNLVLIDTLTNQTGDVRGLEKVNDVVISPDGKHVYTSSSGNNAIAVFERAPGTGILAFVQLYQDEVGGIQGLDGATSLAINAHGNFVYATGRNDNALVVFKRDAENGHLTFIEAFRDGMDQVDGLGGASAVVVSPARGAHVYVAGFADNAIAVFSIGTAELGITISENYDPVKISQNLIYTITVTNKGPHPASGVTLENTLPANSQMLSLSPSQGNCPATTTDKKICNLGTLEVGAKITLSLVVEATDIGELTNVITVASNQFNSGIAQISETTQVIAEADLRLNMTAEPEPVSIDSALTYQITVTNYGPDEAINITVRDEIPDNVTYESAQVGADPAACTFASASRTVTCQLERLAVGTNKLITIVVTPNLAGVKLINAATVSAQTSDLTPENRISQTTEVILNRIVETHDNSGKTLHNYSVSPTGAIIGGSISGTINNQGLISDVRILANSTVSGGKLSKTIENKGTIENAQLLSDTVITGGGLLQGQIFGFPTAPAIVTAQIAANTELSYVTIGIGSQVNPKVKLGEGVTFIDNNTIPTGIDLTGSLPLIRVPMTGSLAIDLSQNIVVNADSLLAAINAIPQLQNDNLAFIQAPDTGYLLLELGNDNIVLVPVAVHQVSSANAAIPSVTIHQDGSVTFVTPTGQQILAQPAPQSPTALLIGLVSWGMPQPQATADGNLTILIADNYFQIRPDLYTQLADPSLPLGLEAIASPFVTNLQIFVLRFQDNTGIHRQQFLYPAPAHPAELQSVLEGFPGADSAAIHNNGKVVITMGARTFSAILGYTVKPGAANTTTQLLFVDDKNGDGTEEIQMLYANGDQQLLYQLPFPIAAEAIQDIAEVKAAGYVVSQQLNGDLLLSQGNTQLLMKVTDIIELAQPKPPSIQVQADGSVEFMTETGLQIFTQPAVQDLTVLEETLRSSGIPTLIVENNGNLTLPINETVSISARPDLTSAPTWASMPLGLHNFPTSLPGVLTVVLVFQDETGDKRSQNLYSAAKYPQELQQFLANLPGAETVQFHNDGTILVNTSEITFGGIFDYLVTASETPTGSIQITAEPDANGDGIEDFAVIYGSGEKQIIYQKL